MSLNQKHSQHYLFLEVKSWGGGILTSRRFRFCGTKIALGMRHISGNEFQRVSKLSRIIFGLLKSKEKPQQDEGKEFKSLR